MTAQQGDTIKKMLIAVSRSADSGNAVMFNVDKDLIQKLAREETIHPDMIVDKKSMNKSKMQRKGGLYVLPMWIKKKITGESVNQGMPTPPTPTLGSDRNRDKNKKGSKVNIAGAFNGCKCDNEECWAPF